MEEYKRNLKKFKENGHGVGCTDLPEPQAEFNQADCEKVIDGKNNASIVLGRDRPKGVFSGYGGAGLENCGSIDLVVGRVGGIDKLKLKEDNTKVNNDYFLDAARILVVQKTNADENLKLAKGKVGNSFGKSAAIIKADEVRIVSRNGVKIVTGTDKYDSNGILINTLSGIDLIANNDDKDLQPIVLGENLKECLSDIMSDLRKTYSEITTIYEILTTLATVMATHVHAVAPLAPLTAPSIEMAAASATANAQAGLHIIDTAISASKNAANAVKYLEVFSTKYINSKFNNSN